MLLTLLFFVVAMGFSVYCWIKQNGILGLLSFLLWFLFTVNAFGLSVARWDLQYDFGIFGVLMAFIMIITSLYRILQRNKMPDEEEPVQEDTYTRVAKRKKKIDNVYRNISGDEESGI